MTKNNQTFEDTIDKLVELVNSQDKALKMANEIITMKTKFIKLCEEETAIYKKENQRLHKVIFGLSLLLGATIVLLLVK